MKAENNNSMAVPSLFAASLSLVPGLGHLMLGRRGRALALFAVDVGFVCSLFFFKSIAGRFLTGFAYFTVMVPAVIETYLFAQGGVSPVSESRSYILVLLLMTGFAALPLLWQSPLFSRRIKIVWSIAVPVLAIIHFGFIGFFGMRLIHEAQF